MNAEPAFSQFAYPQARPEEWRPVPGWPDYEVSNDGRVRRDGRVLKPWRLRNDRWQVRLSRGNFKKSFTTYRLVALAFLGPPPFTGAEVAHIDDDKDNNALENLKWCSHRENCADALRNGRTATGFRNGAHTKPHRRPRGESAGAAKLTWAAVRQIRRSAESHRALGRRFGVTHQTIGCVRRGCTWRAE